MGLNKKLNYFSAIFIICLVAVATLFHFPIHIADALTPEQLTDYGISISMWRIIFEPVLGIFLFFNRSLYALSEIQVLLYWILAIFIIYILIKAILLKEKQARKKFIYRQLVNIPIVTGLWFTFFVLIIFVPFPNNTIINNAPNTILVTTHSHTEYSHDGLMSQEGLWKWHKRNGFDAFFITDHNNHDKTMDFVEAQRNHEFSIEPLVIGGEEFSGSNHLSLLGLKRKFSTKGFSDSTAIDSVHANHGAVIVNHWFDGERMSLAYYKSSGVSGFEIENTATEKTYDREVYQRIKNFCEQNQLLMVGGLDFHGYGNVCSLWNAFQIPGWHKLNPASKEEAILSIIRSNDQSKLKVLLYKDRPYYSEDNLLFSPLFTVFNYFRTLNVFQVVSWVVWISLFTIVMKRIYGNQKLISHFSIDRIIPVKGLAGAVFMLVLGAVYYSRIKHVADFTEMYEEYSTLLLYVGSAFLIYSGVVVYFRIFRSKN